MSSNKTIFDNTTASISEILTEAKKLIEKPENWAQNNYAYDAQGNYVDPLLDIAVCFCSLGAIHKTAKVRLAYDVNHIAKYLERAIDIIYGITNQLGPTTYNDSHTHEEVMKMWDLAIALAKEEETATANMVIETEIKEN